MLNKLKTLREEREDGFTLIELLVVILIIGILSAIAIPVFLNQRKTANDSAVQSDMKNAASQIETWLVTNNNATAIPASTADGVTSAPDIAAIKVSDGVTLKWAKTGTGPVSNGYTICGFHSNGKNYTGDTAALIYNSASGGMQKDAGACPAGAAALPLAPAPAAPTT